MTYDQAKELRLVDPPGGLMNPCAYCEWDTIKVSPSGIRYASCEHEKCKGSGAKEWRCWHPLQKDEKGTTMHRKDSEWLLYFKPCKEIQEKYNKVMNNNEQLSLFE